MVTLAWNWARRLSILLRLAQPDGATEPQKDSRLSDLEISGYEIGRQLAAANPSDEKILEILASAVKDDEIAADYVSLLSNAGWMFPKPYLRRCYVYEMAESIGNGEAFVPEETQELIIDFLRNQGEPSDVCSKT